MKRVKFFLMMFAFLFLSSFVYSQNTVYYKLQFKIPGVGTIKIDSSSFKEGEGFVVPNISFDHPPFNQLYRALRGAELKIDEGAINTDLYLEITLTDLNVGNGGFRKIFNEPLFLVMNMQVWKLPRNYSGNFPPKYSPTDPFDFNVGKGLGFCIKKTTDFYDFITSNGFSRDEDLAFAEVELTGFNPEGITTINLPTKICFKTKHLSKFAGGRGVLKKFTPGSQTFVLNSPKGYNANSNLQTKLFFAPTDSIILDWSKDLTGADMKLKIGRSSGNYTTGSISVSGTRTSFIPGNAPLNLSTGRYYAIITNSDYNTFDEIEADYENNSATIEFSNEVEFIVEAPNAPVPISPRGEINDATPIFQWDAIPGVPAYWLVVSSTPFSVVTSPSGEVSVQGANIVWNYITTETTVRYGDINSDSPYNTEAAPLLSGNEYNYTILNLYDESDISYASTVFGGAFSFTYQAQKKIDSPNLISPPDSSTIQGDENITFTWDPVNGANNYNIYLYQRVSSFAGNDQQIDIPIWNSSTTNTSFTFPALSVLNRGSYVWNVMANDAEGNGSISQTFLFNYIVDMGEFRVQAISTQTNENLIGFEVEANAIQGGVSPANPFIVTNSKSYKDSLVVGTYEFVGKKDGYFDSTFTYEIKKGSLTDITLYLRPYPSIISGTVLDQSDNPLASVSVEVTNIVTNKKYSASTLTNGTFSVTAPKGTYSLKATKPGYISSSPLTITVDDNQYSIGEPIRLVLDKATLSGKVVNDEGKPVILATVKVSKGTDVQQTTTNENGNYSFDLTSGNWKLECSKTGFVSPNPVYVNLAAGDNLQNQNLLLIPKANQVTGFVYKVIGGTGKTPFENVTVVATPDAGSAVTAETNSSGNFTLSLKSGVYTISANVSGYTTDKDYQLTLGIGETVSNIDFTLTPNPSSIQGKVTASDGTAIENAIISADGVTAQSLPNGYYTISVSAGTFEVTASKEGYITSQAKTVTVGVGQNLTGVDFTLLPNAGVISGKVTSGQQPLLNATVKATSGSESHTVKTDEEGKYSFSLQPGTWTLSAQKSGFVTSENLNVSIAAGQQSVNNNFELVKNVATVQGNVKDGATPVANAKVTISEKGNSSNSINTVTSVNGVFNLSVEAGKAYEIKVEKTGYSDYTTQTGVLQPSTFKQLTITLTPNPSSVGGTVFDNSQKPLSGATVTVSQNGSVVSKKMVELDGSYLIGLSAGSFKLKAEKPGYIPDSVNVTLNVGENLTGINFNLTENFAVITGTVTSTEGGGLQSVSIALQGSNGSANLSTDENGNFIYSKIIGGNYEITFSKQGYADTTVSNYQIKNGESKVLNVTLTPLNGKVTGKVTDTNGKALTGASVLMWNSSKSYTAVSGENGNYEIASVVYGSYSLTAIKSGYTNTDTVSLSVTKSAPSVNLDFNSLVENNGVLNGVVKDEEGNAVANVNINLSGKLGAGNAVTNNNGEFSISALAPGVYELTAIKDDYSTVDTSVTINGTVNIALTIERNKTIISGKVTDVFGQPLPFLPEIIAVAKSGKTYTTIANSSGEFEFERVVDNTEYSIFTNIYRQGYTNDSVTVNVPKGTKQITSVNLEIEVHNSVILGSTDVASTTVTLKNKNTGSEKIKTSASDGSYRFDYLPAGEYLITPAKEGFNFNPSSKSVTLHSGDTLTVNFTATSNTGNLKVTTYSSPGQGLAGVNIGVVSSDTTKIFNDVTDSHGEATFNDIPAGTYVIRAYKEGYSAVPESATKTIGSGQSVSVSFTVVKNTAEISGKVIDKNSNPVADVSVKLLFVNSGESKFVNSDNQGNYKFTDLHEGNVILTAIKPGYVSDSLSFNLSSGVKLTDKNIIVEASVVTIKGKVVYMGSGVGNVKITLSSTTSYNTYTDNNGEFKFADVPIKNGTQDTTIYQIGINDPGYPAISEILKLASDKIGQVISLNDFVIPSGQIKLIFTDGENPLDGVVVTITEPNGKTATVVTGSDGVFRTEANLKAGDYSISAKKENYLTPQSSALGVTLTSDSDYVSRNVLLPFRIYPIDSLAADEQGVVKITFKTNGENYSGKFYFKRASAGAFTETVLSKKNKEFTGIIPPQYSTEEINYYAVITDEKDTVKYTSDMFSLTPNAKGILTNLSLNPSIQGQTLRKGDEYLLSLKIRDGLNNSLLENFTGDNAQGSIEWSVDKPDSVTIGIPNKKDPTVILISPEYEGDYKLKVVAKYHGAVINQTFGFSVTSIPIALLTINSPQSNLSNRSAGIQLSVTAMDTTGRFVLLGKQLEWSVDPASAGTVDDNGYFVPSDSNFIGNPVITVSDALTGLEAETSISVYAEVNPASSYFLEDGKGFGLEIPAGAVNAPIQVFLSKAKPGPSKRTFTPLGKTATYTVSNNIYNVQYSSNVALQGDSLLNYAVMTLPVDNSLKFFEGENLIGRYDKKRKNWSLMNPDGKSSTSVTTNNFVKFGEYAVLTKNEPLGLKYVSVLPSPFSPLVAPLKIGYFLTTRDRFARVTIRIYNIRGELVRTLLDNDLQAAGKYGGRTGIKEITWDGLTDNGLTARNGRYIIKISAKDSSGEENKLVKVVLIK